MKLSIPYFSHNGRTYFRRSGDDAKQNERACLGACADLVLADQHRGAKEMAVESKMWNAFYTFWLNNDRVKYRHAFDRP